MKHFLFLAAAAGFLPGLIIRIPEVNANKVLYTSVVTELLSVQKEIVDLHNTFRREVDPPASNMLKMSWEEEVAKNARELSKYCEVGQSNPLKRRITNSFCGENTYLTSSLISWTDVIQTWYNESYYFQYGVWPETDKKKSVYRYTQMIWASSYLIGCDVSSCCERSSPPYFYVCHYCHEGNDPDLMDKPYAQGVTCGHCPHDCENKLCTNPCIYYDEFTNCHELKVVPGCKVLPVRLQCKATCTCTTEIMW